MGDWGKYVMPVGLVLLALAIITVLGLSTYIARKQARTWLYPPRELRLPDSSSLVEAGLHDVEEVEFLTADGLMLRGWFAAADGVSAPAPTVIILHGLSGNRSGMVPEAAFAVARGYNVLLFDLRSHGFSDGGVTTLGFLESDDVRVAVDYLLARPEVDGDRIAILGHSLGGVIALRAAARVPEIKAVVAVSAFASVADGAPDIVRALTGRPPLPFTAAVLQFVRWETGVNVEEVRPINEIATIAPRPVLLIHRAEDSVVPARNSQALFDAAGEPRELFIAENVGHGGFAEIVPEAYFGRIAEFLDRSLGDD